MQRDLKKKKQEGEKVSYMLQYTTWTQGAHDFCNSADTDRQDENPKEQIT